MNHYVYQITNNINGKIYIGRRSCKCNPELDLKYMGSGKNIKAAIKKYGKENFTKTIIDICDSLETANDLEVLIVDESFIKRTDTYNLVIGGPNPIMLGSCHPSFGKALSDNTKFKISLSNKGKTHTHDAKLKISIGNTGKTRSNEYKEKLSKLKKGILRPDFTFTHTEEARRKISDSHIGKQTVSGRKFINKNGKTKLVQLSQLQEYLIDDWAIGRGSSFVSKNQYSNGGKR